MKAYPLLVRIVKEYEDFAAKKKLKLITSLKRTPPIVANEEMFKTVVRNLVSNAIKYTDRGSVEIINMVENGNLVVMVKDTGEGIDKSDLGKLFKAYSRLNPLKEGIGVGLAICKRIVDLHYGNITVESKGAGKGSTFKARFPLEKSNVVKASNKMSGKSGVKGSTMNNEKRDAKSKLGNIQKNNQKEGV